MFSPLLSISPNPNSYLIIILIFSYIHHLPCAISQPDPTFCDKLFHCGNITAGFPYWGEARPQPCGHPSLLLHCDKSSNMTSLIISGQMYRILYIDNSTNTLKLVRQDVLGDSFCNSTLTGTTLTSELFQLLHNYKALFVYYLCNPGLENLSGFKCPKIGVASVDLRDVKYKECGASFNVTVPRSYLPEKGDLDLSRLGDVLKRGFEVKLRIDERPCQECKSDGGICGYDVATPVCCKRNSTDSSSDIKCRLMIPSRSRSSVDERHIHCASWFTCGNQKTLYYPFWTPDREECGHPDFKVNCNKDFPEFSISSVKFRILEMNYESIRVARVDYLNNLCPKFPANAIINQQVLPFLEDTKLQTFYYNCSGRRIDVLPNGYIRHLDCDNATDVQSYFVSPQPNSSNRTIQEGLSASCNRTINIPVSQSALEIAEKSQSLVDMKKALDKGFKLSYNSDCLRCFNSKGTCGYQSLEGFVCYCVDGPKKHTCGKNGKDLF